MQFIDLASQQARIKKRIDSRIQTVLAHGAYIMGPEVQELEQKLADFCGAKHVLGCANGTDALQLALMALDVGVGDAVFVPSFTFAATAEIVPFVGATPVFVDVDSKTYNLDVNSLERAIRKANALGLRPAAVIPVDLFGLAADYLPIQKLADAHDLKIIADSAQGFGANYHGKCTGTLGDVTTTSFFPAKPLGCYGDGGALMTDDDNLAERLSSLRIHGKGRGKYDNSRIGMNSRLDTIQAAVLLEKLMIYPDEIVARQKAAQYYTEHLEDRFVTPYTPMNQNSIWAQYTLLADDNDRRSNHMARLKEAGIPTGIYYPLPLHQQAAYKNFPCDPEGLPVSEMLSQRAFSLPMHAYLTSDDQEKIIAALLAGN